jgi:hypothetical protein
MDDSVETITALQFEGTDRFRSDSPQFYSIAQNGRFLCVGNDNILYRNDLNNLNEGWQRYFEGTAIEMAVVNSDGSAWAYLEKGHFTEGPSPNHMLLRMSPAGEAISLFALGDISGLWGDTDWFVVLAEGYKDSAVLTCHGENMQPISAITLTDIPVCVWRESDTVLRVITTSEKREMHSYAWDTQSNRKDEISAPILWPALDGLDKRIGFMNKEFSKYVNSWPLPDGGRWVVLRPGAIRVSKEGSMQFFPEQCGWPDATLLEQNVSNTNTSSLMVNGILMSLDRSIDTRGSLTGSSPHIITVKEDPDDQFVHVISTLWHRRIPLDKVPRDYLYKGEWYDDDDTFGLVLANWAGDFPVATELAKALVEHCDKLPSDDDDNFYSDFIPLLVQKCAPAISKALSILIENVEDHFPLEDKFYLEDPDSYSEGLKTVHSLLIAATNMPDICGDLINLSLAILEHWYGSEFTSRTIALITMILPDDAKVRLSTAAWQRLESLVAPLHSELSFTEQRFVLATAEQPIFELDTINTWLKKNKADKEYLEALAIYLARHQSILNPQSDTQFMNQLAATLDTSVFSALEPDMDSLEPFYQLGYLAAAAPFFNNNLSESVSALLFNNHVNDNDVLDLIIANILIEDHDTLKSIMQGLLTSAPVRPRDLDLVFLAWLGHQTSIQDILRGLSDDKPYALLPFFRSGNDPEFIQKHLSESSALKIFYLMWEAATSKTPEWRWAFAATLILKQSQLNILLPKDSQLDHERKLSDSAASILLRQDRGQLRSLPTMAQTILDGLYAGTNRHLLACKILKEQSELLKTYITIPALDLPQDIQQRITDIASAPYS